MAQAQRKLPSIPPRGDDEPELCPNCGSEKWELQIIGGWRRCPGCGARWRNGQQGLGFPPLGEDP